MRILRTPLFWVFFITPIFLGGTYSFILDSKRAQAESDITAYVARWKYEFGEYLHENTNLDLIKKVSANLQIFPIENYFILRQNTEIYRWPEVANSAACDRPISTPLSINGFPFGEFVVCLSEAKLAQNTLFSPLFLSLGLLAFLVFVLIGTMPLFRYRRDLDNIMRALEQWQAQPLRPLEAVGYDGTTNKVVSMIKVGIVSEVSLRETQARLEASKELESMAKQFAHDVRSPLTNLESFFTGLSGLTERQIKIVDQSMKRIVAASEDVLRRGREGIQKNSISTNDIKPIVESVIESKKKIAPHIEFALSSDAYCMAECSPGHLANIVSNLLDNSAQAISHQKGKISVSLTSQDGDAVLTISDNGSGIPDHVLPVLFKEEVSHGKANGNGLGLFQAHRKVTDWGGRIAVENKIDSGAEFKIFLKSVGVTRGQRI